VSLASISHPDPISRCLIPNLTWNRNILRYTCFGQFVMWLVRKFTARCSVLVLELVHVSHWYSPLASSDVKSERHFFSRGQIANCCQQSHSITWVWFSLRSLLLGGIPKNLCGFSCDTEYCVAVALYSTCVCTLNSSDWFSVVFAHLLNIFLGWIFGALKGWVMSNHCPQHWTKNGCL
jgi:hypothetical protein